MDRTDSTNDLVCQIVIGRFDQFTCAIIDHYRYAENASASSIREIRCQLFSPATYTAPIVCGVENNNSSPYSRSILVQLVVIPFVSLLLFKMLASNEDKEHKF